MNNCIFCQIVNGEVSSHNIWEDENYMAFLSIYPNTPGLTVVVPKIHYPSYYFNLPDEILAGLILASKKVANLLDDKLEGVGRTAMVLEGFGVDHVHSKLIPLHGTAQLNKQWQPITAISDKFFEKYEGYISTHDCKHADPFQLQQIVKKICS